MRLKKNINSRRKVGFLLLIFIFLLTGCTPEKDVAIPQETIENPSYKFALVTENVDSHEHFIQESVKDGLNKLKTEEDIQFQYLESKDKDEFIANLNHFGEKNYDFIWSLGFIPKETLEELVKKYPNQKFGLIGYRNEGFENVYSIRFAEEEAGFLAGVVAGKTTKTNKIGFVGGMTSFPTVEKYGYGFMEGVKSVNPKAEIMMEFAEDFQDVNAGKKAAKNLFDHGADIILQAPDEAGRGIFEEAKARKLKGENVWVIGLDADQTVTYGHDIVLTSAIKKVDEAIYSTSLKIAKGEKVENDLILGVKDNVVGLPDQNPNISEETKDLVEEFKQKLINGEIQLHVSN